MLSVTVKVVAVTDPVVVNNVIAPLVLLSVTPVVRDVACVTVPPDPVVYPTPPAPEDNMLEADNVVNAPVEAVVDPIGPGAANVAPPSVEALTAVLQPNPVFVVHVTAEAEVLHDVIDNAVGEADPFVALPTTVLVPIAATPLTGNPVALVKTAADGVPRLGVTNAGDVESAIAPEPLTAVPSAVATPVPKDVMPVPPPEGPRVPHTGGAALPAEISA